MYVCLQKDLGDINDAMNKTLEVPASLKTEATLNSSVVNMVRELQQQLAVEKHRYSTLNEIAVAHKKDAFNAIKTNTTLQAEKEIGYVFVSDPHRSYLSLQVDNPSQSR